MSTDQIQTKLYERSDKETEARVVAALEPAWNYARKNLATNWRLSLKVGSALCARDGTKIHPGMSSDDITRAVLNAPIALVPVSDVLQELRRVLTEMSKGADRQNYVEQFLADFEKLKGQVEELGDRVGGLEDA